MPTHLPDNRAMLAFAASLIGVGMLFLLAS